MPIHVASFVNYLIGLASNGLYGEDGSDIILSDRCG